MAKRLYRSRQHRVLGGVCGGIAEYGNLDPTVVRLIWALSALFPVTTAVALVGYVVAWLLMPEEPAV